MPYSCSWKLTEYQIAGWARGVSELVQDSLPVAKAGWFFVSFCIFEGA